MRRISGEKKLLCYMMPVDRIKTNCLGGGVEGLPTDHQQGNSDSITTIQFRLSADRTFGT